MSKKDIYSSTAEMDVRDHHGLHPKDDGDLETLVDFKMPLNVVSHPPHYNQGGMEVIDVIEAGIGDQGFIGYLLGNILKYLLRFRHKGKPIEDLKKARWYLDKLIAVVSEEKTNK